MRIAIVGNNDGPLTLLKSLQEHPTKSVLVGLQKPVDKLLENEYKQFHNGLEFFTGFDEKELLMIGDCESIC